MTDPNGNSTAYHYNENRQPDLITDCSGYETKLAYTPEGQLARITDALGQHTEYHYDADQNLTLALYPDGSKETFGYDAAGRLKTHTDGEGHTTSYEYGQDGLPTRRTNALGHTFGYHYDKARRLVGLTNENGARYRFAYDVLDRLIAESGFDHKLTGYRYNAGNELVEQREFGDDASLAAKLMAQLGGQPVPKKDAAPLSDDLNPIPDNRLKTYNGTTYYYDDLGNLIHRELADGEVQNYFYDLHDQLVKAEIFKKDGTKETWAYSYDALGRRIGKGRLKDGEVSETSFPHDLSGNDLENQTRFVWDGSHLLQEVHPDGRYTYIYTDPSSYEPLAQVRNRTNKDGESCQQTHYFHCDQIGIPREITDKDGNLLWLGSYTGWGRLKEETKVTDSAYQPFRLQNQYADRETGLHYNFFRYYEPDAGRFVNQDPIGLMGGMNLYQFAPNTQQWIDHLGLDVNIIRSDRSVTFILDISLNGRNVTNTDIENVKNGIERNWNAGGWKYGGCNIRFIANVKANDSKMANQITAEPINGRSYVNKAGGNRGVWYMRDPNVSWVAAHEAGHLMGLGDRYKDINGKSIPQKGWENNIMAAPNKPVEQRNINELIPFTTKCACNILEYM